MALNIEALPRRIKPADPEGQHINQLQFNLESAPRAFNLETNFHKPKPIVIEKLRPERSAYDRSVNPIITMARSSSSFSSDRLEFAMQLAKRDVRKLKNMLAEPNIDISGIIDQQTVGNEAVQHSAMEERKVSYNKKASKVLKVPQQMPKEVRNREKNIHFGKMVTAISPEEKGNAKSSQFHFYDSDGEIKDEEVKGPKSPILKTREMSEIKRLRKELQKYMKRLDSVLEQKDIESKDADPIKRKTHFQEATEYERKEHRAEEQAARSARVLYMLQRKVQEIQDELEEKGYQIKHTKKSQSLTRLAAAHRAAVRALQMFVNQAPLYYDLKHGLPPMYNELALLIQQLSLLSSRIDAGKDLPHFDLDLLPRTKKLISSWDQKRKPISRREAKGSQRKPILQKEPQQVEWKSKFLDEHEQWIKERMKTIDQSSQNEVNLSRKTNEPTPEREAALQAGLDALERARESSSFLPQTANQKTTNAGLSNPRRTGRPSGKSVLIPHHIKKSKQSSLGVRRAKKPTYARRFVGKEMGFAKQTVSSTLKQQPEIAYEPKRVKIKSPAYNEIPEGVHITFGTPKQRDKEILKIASPRSPRNETRYDEKVEPHVVDFDYGPLFTRTGISEREAARQAWLDRERDREMKRLAILRRREEEHLEDLSDKYTRAQDIVNRAEEKIKDHLQPLLDKAELISMQEKLHEDQYRRSVQRKLADIVTDTAMSRGELLADMILDDILTETVYELQRIEDKEEAEANAIFERNRPTFQSIAQRLDTFEKEEEQIRRRWKKLHYSELDIDSGDPKKRQSQNGAKPIIFTSAASAREPNYMISKTDHPRDRCPPLKPTATRVDVNRQDHISDDMKASILSYQKKYEKYLKRTIMEQHGTFNPWEIIEKISDQICDELVSEVEKEIEDLCDEYVEEVYKEEFLKNDSTMSEVSISDKTL